MCEDDISNLTSVEGEGGSVGVAGRGVAGTLTHIVKTEGATALYSGIVPGLQRQMAFSAIRIGAYESVKETYQEMTGVTGGVGLLGVRIAAGVTTGKYQSSIQVVTMSEISDFSIPPLLTPPVKCCCYCYTVLYDCGCINHVVLKCYLRNTGYIGCSTY